VPRDYKYRAQRKPKKKPLPAWLWLLTGLLLGAFIFGLVWLRGQSQDAGGGWVGAQPDRLPQGPVSEKPTAEVPPPPKPRFDFYDLLPKMEVVVPDEELDAPPVPSPVSPAESSGPSRYLVQVGSFRAAEDADRLKAQLALLGFEARVVPARIDNRQMRYRVRLGPHVGKDAVNTVRRQAGRQRLPGDRDPGRCPVGVKSRVHDAPRCHW
jgi:cell division septation protein DedD